MRHITEFPVLTRPLCIQGKNISLTHEHMPLLKKTSHLTGNDCTGQVRVADICTDKGWNAGLIKWRFQV